MQCQLTAFEKYAYEIKKPVSKMHYLIFRKKRAEGFGIKSRQQNVFSVLALQ